MMVKSSCDNCRAKNNRKAGQRVSFAAECITILMILLGYQIPPWVEFVKSVGSILTQMEDKTDNSDPGEDQTKRPDVETGEDDEDTGVCAKDNKKESDLQPELESIRTE